MSKSHSSKQSNRKKDLRKQCQEGQKPQQAAFSIAPTQGGVEPRGVRKERRKKGHEMGQGPGRHRVGGEELLAHREIIARGGHVDCPETRKRK